MANNEARRQSPVAQTRKAKSRTFLVSLMERTFKVKILRQANPTAGSNWETFDLTHEVGMNMTTVFQRIAANPVTEDNEKTTPPAYDASCLEEICGACTMVINGHVRQAFSALIPELLEDRPVTIQF